MKVLFIGGTGSISTASTELLVSMGVELTLITRGNKVKRLPANVEHIKADFNKSFLNLRSQLCSTKWDAVINWNIYNRGQAARDIEYFYNITSKYYFVSTTAIYGKIDEPINENTKVYNTVWDYAINKKEAEDEFLNAYIHQNFPIVILRPSHTYCDFTIPTNIQGL
jgi:nucleoside-diphosphate-sugar epimerase